jgi:hypothetical protein
MAHTRSVPGECPAWGGKDRVSEINSLRFAREVKRTEMTKQPAETGSKKPLSRIMQTNDVQHHLFQMKQANAMHNQ